MNDEVKTIHVHAEKPSRSKPGGVSVTGHYRIDGKFVVLCRPDGVPIEIVFERRLRTWMRRPQRRDGPKAPNKLHILDLAREREAFE